MALSTRDTWLASFMDLTLRLEFSVGFTVTAGGLLISGKAISSAEFIRLEGERFIDALSRADDGMRVESWQQYFTETAEAVAKGAELARDKISQVAEELSRTNREVSEEEQQRNAEEFLPQFICMKDVVIFGAYAEPIRLPLWRGRLSEISGWTFGELQPGAPEAR